MIGDCIKFDTWSPCHGHCMTADTYRTTGCMTFRRSNKNSVCIEFVYHCVILEIHPVVINWWYQRIDNLCKG